MRTLTFLISILLITFNLFAQENPVDKYAKLIKLDSLKKHVYTLASDSCQGRYPTSLGMQKAKHYIVSQWKQSNTLKKFQDSSYFQKIPYFKLEDRDLEISINGKKLTRFKDYFFNYLGGKKELEIPIVFANEGIMEQIMQSQPQKKAIFIVNNSMYKNNVISNTSMSKAEIAIFANKNLKEFKENTQIQKTIFTEQDRLVSEKSLKYALNNKFIKSRELYLNKEIIKSLTGKKFKYWYRKAKKGKLTGKPVGTLKLKASTYKHSKTSFDNIISYIPGKNINEYIVIGAHFDHLGINGKYTYFGADDNASGTSALIEISKIFAKATEENYQPEKTIIFAAFNAEELGLVGSKYFVKHFKNSNQIKLMLNIDMIGRHDSKHKKEEQYFYFSGKSKQHHKELNNEICKKYNIKADYTSRIAASDNLSFSSKGIPAIFYFTGLHPDYHKFGDTPEKIDYQKMTKITKVIFETLWRESGMKKK